MAQNEDDTAKVAALASRQWMTRDVIIKTLGVSTRTFYRRVNSGEILRRKTPEGTRYQLTKSATLPSTSQSSPSDSASGTKTPQTATALAVAQMAVEQTKMLAELLRKEKAERMRWQAVALKLLGLEV